MAKANLTQFKEFRDQKIDQLNKGRITPEEFHDYIYGFLVRTKIKPTMKPKNRQQALQNYYYWTSYIERKIIIEQKLVHYNMGSLDQLREAIKIFTKRREKALSFLFLDLKEKPLDIEGFSEKSIKIILKDGHELYSSTEFLSEMQLNKSMISNGKISNYSRLFVLFLESI
jgi:hypothetical protein